ncbi:MAG: YgiQ family radical SAM protein [Clostridia bacterium]|nr:YgiQ family radical SAM protein [Clostridia bacterium]
MSFLPISRKEIEELNIEQLDFIYVSGDAYVDHPSFGHAIISRIVESQGFTIGIIPQPVTDDDYLELGTPKFAFLVGSGVVDSMVNNYTVAKKKRTTDVYSEGGQAGKRPDRALTVYCKNLRRLFGDTPIIIGGIEASLRRFAHYDYWADKVMPSILLDTDADLLMYGMGEVALFNILEYAKKGIPLKHLTGIEGTAFKTTLENMPKRLKQAVETYENIQFLPSYENVQTNKLDYIKAFKIAYENTDNLNSNILLQKHNEIFIVQNKPSRRMTTEELDFAYSLPYEKTYHPIYTKGVPAILEVEFSVNSHRGCYGNCSFCAITYHQGRAVQRRSKESILKEVEALTHKPNFKGYIHDLGGPSANFFEPACEKQLKYGVCKNRQCIGKDKCPNLKISHEKYLEVLREARKIPNVKKVFIRSGIRFDYILYDNDKTFFEELCKHHISGQLKIAPEHICNNVLDFMNKPHKKSYLDFVKMYEDYNKKIGKRQFLVPYFISSHPACTLENAIELAQYLKSINHIPEQVQDFYPTPSTLSTTAYYTELDPNTLQPIFVAKSKEDKAMQRALLQYKLPQNFELVKLALTKANRTDLIGNAKHCLIKEYKSNQKKTNTIPKSPKSKNAKMNKIT